jgi:magnesium chelatase family protein
MAFGTVMSATISGIKVEMINVEADVSNGLPMFSMVGYLSSEVKEAGERVRTALKNSGFEYPAKRIIVNLSPATVRKKGAIFDLPIAISIMISAGQIPQEKVNNILMVGELG